MKKNFAVVTMLLVLYIGVSNGSAQLKQLQQAPDFSLISTEEETVTLSEQLGKIVILHFWKSN